MTNIDSEKLMKVLEEKIFGPGYTPPPHLTDEERFKKFRTWWKLDDPAWVEQRKEEWKHIRSNSMVKFSAKELKHNGRFYLTGEEPPPVTQGGGPLGTKLRLALTPFTSVEDARELYYTISAINRSGTKVNSLLPTILKHGEGLPWVKPKIKACAEVIFGHEYRKIEEPQTETDSKLIVTSPEPTGFSLGYYNRSLGVFNKNIDNFHCINLVDYFVSALAHANKPAQRKDISIDKLLQTIDTVLADPESHTELANDLARKLKEKESQMRENWSIHSDMDE